MADVPAALKDWSPTSGNNFPQGTATVGNGLDDNLRELAGGVVRGLSHKGADIASSSTTDIGAVEGYLHDITGTTTISGFGTVRSGIAKKLRFRGVLTLTYNATSMILPGGGNILTADGDVGEFFSLGSGNWVCLSYTYGSSGSVPPGTIMDFASSTAPSGWLACDGTAVSRTTYARLFAVIGTTWGSGNGSTTFNVPSLARRVLVGSGGSGTGTLGATVGSTGGSETHTITEAQLPSHTHSVPSLSVSATGSGNVLSDNGNGGGASTALVKTTNSSGNETVSGAATSISVSGSTGTGTSGGGSGSGSAHNIMQPAAVVLKIIKT